MPLPHHFASYEHGDLRLPHRVAMAPMTRNRSPETVPTDRNATYYAQRASAAILVTEGTQPDPAGQGYLGTPGLHDDAQQRGWARVAAAVRAEGPAPLVIQLMHCGRVAHPYYAGGATPVAPSAVRHAGTVRSPDGDLDYVTPRAIGHDELPAVRETFVQAARRAVAAGAAGVELHAANGYLLHQFLASNTNLRTDGYGTDVAGRVRFVAETVDAVAAAIGARRTAIRISPGHAFNGIEEADPEATYDALLRALARHDLLYVHVMETRTFTGFSSVEQARRLYPGTLMANAAFTDEFDVAGADALLGDGRFDLVAYGRRFLANPDLPRRLREDAPLNAPDPATFYAGGAEGYTDYPALDAAAA